MSLIDFYTSLKAIEASFPIPEPEANILLGVLDLTPVIKDIGFGSKDPKYDDEIVFRYSIPFYEGPGYSIPVTLDEPGHPIVYYHVSGKGGILNITNIHTLNINISITNWASIGASGNLSITLGAQTQNVKYGESLVTFKVVTETNPNFSIIVNNVYGSNPVKALLPLKINWSKIAAGAITIPVIPVALVYAPVVDPEEKNSANTSTTISVGNVSTFSFSNLSSNSQPISSSFQNISDLQKLLNSIGTDLSKTPDDYTKVFGDTLVAMATAFGTATSSITNSTTVTTQNSISVTTSTTVGLTAFSNDGGPGVGDLIEYLYNVKVIWYSNDGILTLAILGYEGSNQTTIGKLIKVKENLKKQPIGTKDNSTNLDLVSLESLLAIDPFVFGGPNVALKSPRFIDISKGKLGIGGGGYSLSYTYEESSTSTQTSISTITRIEDDSPGFLALFGLGVSENHSLQVQISQSNIMQFTNSKKDIHSFNLVGGNKEYYCWVYYDTIFSVFAFRNMTNE